MADYNNNNNNNNINDNDEQQDVYDEFGNYIGPDLDDDNDSDSDDSDETSSSGSNSEASNQNSNNQQQQQQQQQQQRPIVVERSRYDEDDDEEVGQQEQEQEQQLIVPSDVVTLSTSTSHNNNSTNQESLAIVLHEDKEIYLSANEIYGTDVTIAVVDEDAMDIDTPIVQPVITETFQTTTGSSSKSNNIDPNCTDGSNMNQYMYTSEYMIHHMNNNDTCETRRSFAFVGHYHHGKTSLIDLIIESTFIKQLYWGPRASLNINNGGGPRYLDIWNSEVNRQMSLVSTPITTVVNDIRGKSYCCTIIDTPGHVNFHDECVCTMRSVDGIVLVIDVVEGIQLHTEMLLRQAVLVEGIPIVIVLNKLDRLIIELKLPPKDAYYKLLHIIESVNDYVSTITNGQYPIKFSPERNNVAFSSPQHGYIFTLSTFAQLYSDYNEQQNYYYNNDDTDDEDDTTGNNDGDNNYLKMNTTIGMNLSIPDFAKRLWGDCYYDSITKTFKSSASDCTTTTTTEAIERTFVTFILQPIYKLYSLCLGEVESNISTVLKSIGIILRKDDIRNSSVRPLLRTVFTKFFDTSSVGSFVSMIIQHIPNPKNAAYGKISRFYTGPVPKNKNTTLKDNEVQTKLSPIVQSMIECNSNGPVIIHCTKNYTTANGKSFVTLGRVYSGTVHVGDPITVLGNGYTPDNTDDDDYSTSIIEQLSIPRGHESNAIHVNKVTAGNWILIHGIDTNIAKTATIVSSYLLSNSNTINESNIDEQIHIFAPIKFPQAGDESVMKLAIEPINPSELPKMVDGLRRISKAYPMSKTKVEESGEHIILGTGELYLDCIMYDLRTIYSQIEIKVSDPIVSFRETVQDTSAIQCTAQTANKRNTISCIAESLDDGLATKLEQGKIKINEWDNKKMGRYFQSQYNWDLLSSRSIWAFGDSSTHGTNILLDDTLPSEVDKLLLNTCKSSIVQGFQWATREGPLCEEPVRSTKIKLLNVSLSDKPIYRGGGQIIPTSRRVVHSAILTASPRLMEPIYHVHIQCPASIVDSIQPVLAKRRGQIISDKPIVGTTLYTLKGYIPILDSFGFETDIRTYTQGQAMVYSIFDHWAIVPGDPLDTSILLHPLEPSPNSALGRELLIKTRRRKGLSEDVIISKYFDESMKNLLSMDTNNTGNNISFQTNTTSRPLIQQMQ